MYYLKWLLSWFIVGFICTIFGTVSDWIFYKKKPTRKLMDYIFPTLIGYVCIPILLISIYNKIKK